MCGLKTALFWINSNIFQTCHVSILWCYGMNQALTTRRDYELCLYVFLNFYLITLAPRLSYMLLILGDFLWLKIRLININLHIVNIQTPSTLTHQTFKKLDPLIQLFPENNATSFRLILKFIIIFCIKRVWCYKMSK